MKSCEIVRVVGVAAKWRINSVLLLRIRVYRM
jgi:hypothetical protein